MAGSVEYVRAPRPRDRKRATIALALLATLLVVGLVGATAWNKSRAPAAEASSYTTFDWSFSPPLDRPVGGFLEGEDLVKAEARRVAAFQWTDGLPSRCQEYVANADRVAAGKVARLVDNLFDACSASSDDADMEIARAEDPVAELWYQRAELEKRLPALREQVSNARATNDAHSALLTVVMQQYFVLTDALIGVDFFMADYDPSDDPHGLTLSSGWLNLLNLRDGLPVVAEMVAQWFPDAAQSCQYTGPADLYEDIWARPLAVAASIDGYEGDEPDWMKYYARGIANGTKWHMTAANESSWYPYLVYHESLVGVWAEYARILAAENPLLLPDFDAARLMVQELRSGPRAILMDRYVDRLDGYSEPGWPYQPGTALTIRSMAAYEWKFDERFECPEPAGPS